MKTLLFALSSWTIFAASTFAENGGFRLTSATWHEGGTVPQESVFNGAGCGGANVSPELRWSGAPTGTKSFAVTIFDQDAPTGNGWWHWVIFNIPGTTLELPAGAGSKGSRGLPPGRTHRYLVRAYALNVERFSAGSEASPAKIVEQIEQHSLGVAKLTVKFGR